MGEPDSPLLAGEGQGERFACASQLQRGEELVKKLQEPGKERIRELVRNPLRLSLLCQTSYLLPVDEPLPETKAALYERFTRYFYEWKQEQHPTTRTERRQLNQALGELAKAGINSKVRFRLGEDFACDVMGEPLFDLACRLGWLNLVDREANTDEAVYAFFHPTFQEYFAACAIYDWRYFLNHNNENPNPFLKYNNKDCEYRVLQLINILKSYLSSSQRASKLSDGSSDSTYNPSVEEILSGRIEIDAVNDLIKEVSKNQEPSKSIEALLKLRRIIPGKSSRLVVEGLKKFLQDLVPNQQNWLVQGYCIEIMHCCAQNMSYPDFYQAWHQPTIQ
jgi:hypothetical protein